MEEAQKIEDFYGVYLLCSQSLEKKYHNRCYIGYTVNPNRRINQHNRGIDFGGAKRTNNKGPWLMIMIIHGFPNNISALQFEWAWQWPNKSSRLKIIPNLEKKKRNETYFDYNFRILSEMLRIGPWNRLPLKIRWLAEDYIKDFPPNKIPPLHMQICHGHVVIKKKSKQQLQENEMKLIINENSNKIDYNSESQTLKLLECHLCMKIIENPIRSKINCINPKCKLICHIICLANQFLENENGHYIPIEGDCPICETHILWGDLIRKKNGCNDLEDYKEGDDDDDDVENENDYIDDNADEQQDKDFDYDANDDDYNDNDCVKNHEVNINDDILLVDDDDDDYNVCKKDDNLELLLDDF